MNLAWNLLSRLARGTETLIVACVLISAGCGGGEETGDVTGDTDAVAEVDVPTSIPEFVVMTFNTGTSEQKGGERDDDDYNELHAAQSDEYYGDGLAWKPAVEKAREFIAAVAPDIIVFQEIFYSEECAVVPEASRTDFVCSDWQTGDPTVAQVITGVGYQVMCHWEKHDKCAAVKRTFGSFRGCSTDFCLDGMEGYRVETCGSGSRIGRGIIDLNGGGTITLVNVHGTSGFKEDEMQCRVWQFQQVFEDFGDGTGLPAASGDHNIIMGDFNTDPGRAVGFDPSAVKLVEHVGPEKDLKFLTEVGEFATPTYGGIGNIDHVISNAFTGSCSAAGVTEGHPAVIDAAYFDHTPITCILREHTSDADK